VLRMLRFIVRAGKARGVPVTLCGEMAASPELIPTLLGLGLRELSCPPRAVPRVRSVRATEIAAPSAKSRRNLHERRLKVENPGVTACARPDRPLRRQGPYIRRDPSSASVTRARTRRFTSTGTMARADASGQQAVKSRPASRTRSRPARSTGSARSPTRCSSRCPPPSWRTSSASRTITAGRA
jgi:hypothetical protein